MNDWDKLSKELECDIMMQEYLIPRTLIYRWHKVQTVGDGMQKQLDKTQEENEFLRITVPIERARYFDALRNKLISQREKLEAIRDLVEAYRVSGDHSLARAHITLFKIDEVLGDE